MIRFCSPKNPFSQTPDQLQNLSLSVLFLNIFFLCSFSDFYRLFFALFFVFARIWFEILLVFYVLFLRFLSVIFNVVCFHSCFCLFVFWFLRVLFWYSSSPNRPRFAETTHQIPVHPYQIPLHPSFTCMWWGNSPKRRPDSVRQLIKSPSTPPFMHLMKQLTK